MVPFFFFSRREPCLLVMERNTALSSFFKDTPRPKIHCTVQKIQFAISNEYSDRLTSCSDFLRGDCTIVLLYKSYLSVSMQSLHLNLNGAWQIPLMQFPFCCPALHSLNTRVHVQATFRNDGAALNSKCKAH